jgi:hemerythrin-like domain-containing protein
MPVQIGSVAHSFSDPVGLLMDCHRRVEMFIGALDHVAETSDQPLSDENRRSLDLSLRYFREAAPKHTADEEDSLFPRLRSISDEQLQASLARLDELESDHRWAEPLHAAAEELGSKYLNEGQLAIKEANAFRSATHQLQEMYRRHIEVEDREVFPVANRVLSADVKKAIANEMQHRRGLNPVVQLK